MRIVLDRLISPPVGLDPVIQMGAARQNPAVARVESWAEEIRASEFEKAMRQLQALGLDDKDVVESLSRRIVGELLAPPTAFAGRSSRARPNSRRLPLLCGMFDRQGAKCPGSHCPALHLDAPPPDCCETLTIVPDGRKENIP